MSARPLLVVLRALGLGDLLTAVPALRALRRSHPGHRLVLATSGDLGPLLRATGLLADGASREHRVLDQLVSTEGLAPLPDACDGADLAVNLHGRGPRSTAVLAATRPRRLVAFDTASRPRTGAVGPAWREGEHEVHRWCRLVRWAGADPDPTDLHVRVTDPAAGAGIPAGEAPRAVPGAVGATVVHPGAGAPARRWPVDRFAAVARAELASGRRVVVTGSAPEAGLARRVATAAGLSGQDVLAGRLDLAGLAAVVASAGRVVCGDTGMAHLATACSTPSVVVFGPTPPQEWGPPEGGPHVALWAGRRGDPHGRSLDPGLARITVDDVLAALHRLPDVGTRDRLPDGGTRAGTDSATAGATSRA